MLPLTEKAPLTQPPQRIESSFPATPTEASCLEECKREKTCSDCCKNSDGKCFPLKSFVCCRKSKKSNRNAMDQCRGNQDAVKPSHSSDAINFANMYKEPEDYYAPATQVRHPQVNEDAWGCWPTNTKKQIGWKDNEQDNQEIADTNQKNFHQPNGDAKCARCWPLKYICRKSRKQKQLEEDRRKQPWKDGYAERSKSKGCWKNVCKSKSESDSIDGDTTDSGRRHWYSCCNRKNKVTQMEEPRPPVKSSERMVISSIYLKSMNL